MPELPEVETLARQLNTSLKMRKLLEVSVLDPKLKSAGLKSLLGMQVARVFRSGKELVMEFRADKRNCFLCTHLRMTGVMLWMPDQGGVRGVKYARRSVQAIQSTGESKAIRAQFVFRGGELQFRDVRRFGTLAVRSELLGPRGADPVSEQFTLSVLTELLHRSPRQNLKAFLMRQDRIVGIGNIYASEILFLAKICPERKCESLQLKERQALFRAIRKILAKAIENAGTTISDFQDSLGNKGNNQNFLKVYDREGEQCKRCRTEIVRLVQQQRSTFFCPGCQF